MCKRFPQRRIDSEYSKGGIANYSQARNFIPPIPECGICNERKFDC